MCSPSVSLDSLQAIVCCTRFYSFDKSCYFAAYGQHTSSPQLIRCRICCSDDRHGELRFPRASHHTGGWLDRASWLDSPLNNLGSKDCTCVGNSHVETDANYRQLERKGRICRVQHGRVVPPPPGNCSPLARAHRRVFPQMGRVKRRLGSWPQIQ